ncbi:unnamed protein product [Amaranthus hypochondriacus]
MFLRVANGYSFLQWRLGRGAQEPGFVGCLKLPRDNCKLDLDLELHNNSVLKIANGVLICWLMLLLATTKKLLPAAPLGWLCWFLTDAESLAIPSVKANAVYATGMDAMKKMLMLGLSCFQERDDSPNVMIKLLSCWLL